MPGLVLVAGGKYTTYRVMAKDAVDAAAHSLGGPVHRPASPSGSRWSAPRASRPGATRRQRLARRPGCTVPGSSTCSAGTATWSTSCSTSSPTARAGRAAAGGEDYLRAEVVYAVTHEGARHLDDVLTRRTRISIETFDRGVGAARPAADLMAGASGGTTHAGREVDHYLRRVEAERDSQRKTSDREADEARMRAGEAIGTWQRS